MNFFSKQKLIAWLIVILVILNLGTLATLWIGHFRRPASGPPPGGGPPDRARNFLIKELGFDEEQRKELANLQSRQLDQMNAFQARIDEIKGQMMDELLKTDPDNVRVEELAGEVGGKEAQKAKLAFNHLQEIKILCRPEQKERFDILVRDLLEIMKPPGPPGRPGGPRPENNYLPPSGKRSDRSRTAPPGRLDADGDGKVSKNEWANHHREVFQIEIDLDGDGYASESEWREHHEQKRTR